MDGKTALVTGAASGIGKATAIGLAKQGARVTILVRSREKGDAAARDIMAAARDAPPVEVLVCDLASQSSIRAAAREFLAKHEKLHVLVNAAGVFRKTRNVTPDGLEETFATNHMAYFLLTNLLVDALKKGAPSRVVNVASKYGGAKVDFDDLQTEKKYSYLKSTPKTMVARVLFTQEMAERLAGTGVTVNTLHPGLIANTALLNDTGGIFRWLTNRMGKTPEVGADTAVWLATAPEVAGTSGKMFEKRREIKTPGQGSDVAARKRLWAESEKLAKMSS